MFSHHPILLTEAPQNWQVLPQRDGFAVLSVKGQIRTGDVSGKLHYRVVAENSGKTVIPWTPAVQRGASFSAEARLPVGGPYRLETCALPPNTEFKDAMGGDMRQHLFAGDLYLIAGQSNAVGFARDRAYDPPCIGVSVLRVSGSWDLASHPLHDGTDNTYINLDVPMPAQSPWLTFAKTIYHRTGIPVGLIPTALGGSPLEAWLPGGILFENAVKMAAFCGELRGVLWYQGCADALALQTKEYLPGFLKSVREFRRRLKAPKLPFFTCQLNGFTEPGEGLDEAFSAIRNAQQAAAEEEGIYLLPTAGMRLYDQIHNSAASNCRIGRQMAQIVLAAVYGKDCRCLPLRAVSVAAEADRLTVTVSPVEGTLRVKNAARKMFEASSGGEALKIERVYEESNRLILCGKGLHRAQLLRYAQKKDVTDAGISDSAGGWMLMPFELKIPQKGEK